MRLFRIISMVIPLLTTVIHAFAPVTPSSEIFDIRPDKNRALEDIVNDFILMTEGHLSKRDVSSLESLILTVYDSGIIFDALHEIAGSQDEMDALANSTISLVKSGGGVIEGFNITLNVSKIFESVNKSGLVQSVLQGILLNETNRVYVANVTGETLRHNIWLPQILSDVGNGRELTLDYIAYTIRNAKSKDPSYQSSKEVIIGKRDNTSYTGSAQAFLNNLINSVLQSQLVSDSLDNFLLALNNTGVAVPIALQLLNDTEVKNMAGYVLGKVYDSGVINIDLNKYFVAAKISNMLSDSVQRALTDPKYSPALAKIFQQMEYAGVFQAVQKNLFG